MTSTISNGMTTILSKEKIFTTNIDEKWVIKKLTLFWLISIDIDESVITVNPSIFTGAILEYSEDHESQIYDFKDWVFEIYKIEERTSPYQFFILEADIDFKNKKIIVSI